MERNFPQNRTKESSGRPMLIGHRGAAALAPENTLAAFQKAISFRVDYVECDIRITADQVPVVFHDRDLKRLTGLTGEISNWHWPDLQRQARILGSEPILSFDELIEYLNTQKVGLFAEIKTPSATESAIKRINEYFFKERVMLGSFYEDVVQMIIQSGLPALQLVDEDEESPEQIIQNACRRGASCIGLPLNLATAGNLHQAKEAHLQTWVWTVNDPHQMKQLAIQGADALITDRPDLFWKALLPL
ncbi:MAG: glycerophosphodiester phosphodiesterase [Chthoniobacterales bacterium]|nr:glycerophosphodiester phosphodiesterase [Chthoniobacterales bacterium]